MNIRESNFKVKTFKIIRDVVNDLILPTSGQMFRLRVQQAINLISLIIKIASEFVIDELTIVTYTFNRESIETIIDLFKSGRIKKLNLVISSSYSFRDNKYYGEIKTKILALGENAHLVFCWSHMKITIARCGDNYFQFEGSMNYSTNNMAEQIIFENSKETYDYDYDFIMKSMLEIGHKGIERIC